MNDIEKLPKYQKEYSESKFSKKILKYAKQAGCQLVYCAFLIHELIKSPNVPIKYKAMLCGALGYFILPLDLIPDAVPLIGYSDDLSAIIAVLKIVSSLIDDKMRERALENAKKIFGDVDIKESDMIF